MAVQRFPLICLPLQLGCVEGSHQYASETIPQTIKILSSGTHTCRIFTLADRTIILDSKVIDPEERQLG